MDATPNHDSEDTQVMFATRSTLFWNPLYTACEEENVETAIAILIDPKLGGTTPMVFLRGEKYEQAKLLVHLLTQLKDEIMAELSI